MFFQLYPYLNDLGIIVGGAGELQHLGGDETNGVENGATEVDDREVRWRRPSSSRELDLLDMFLELPIVNKGVFPFWY